MSEFIIIQVGQCGNQIGSAFWPQVLYEHGVFVDNIKHSLKKIQDDAFHSFFHNPSGKRCFTFEDLRNNKVKARAVLIDMENSVVDRFHNSKLRDIFDRSYSLTDSPGSGNNWAVGHYTHGGANEEKIREVVRGAVERCDSLAGFLVLFSLGGGTGSGLGTAILKFLKEDYPVVDRIVTCIHPGEHKDVVTGPYNVAFALKQLLDHATCVLPIDNKALHNICCRFKDVKDPLTSDSYQMMNRLVVRMLLHLTCGARFPGVLNFDLSDLSTNMIPLKGMHFLASSLSHVAFTKEKDVAFMKKKNELLHGVCSENNHLIQFYSLKKKVFTTALLARGDISFSVMTNFEERLSKSLENRKWSCFSLKGAMCSVPPHDVPASLLLLSNSSGISSLFRTALQDFNRLYLRKAYMHHYLGVDDFETNEFTQARESLLSQIDIYSQSYEYLPLPRFRVEP